MIRIALTAGLALVGLVAFSGTAEAATSKQACEKKLKLVNNVKNNIEQKKQNHFVYPADKSVIIQDDWVHVDKTGKHKTNTGMIKVRATKNGKVVDQKRKNYPVILERHQGGYAAITAKLPATNNLVVNYDTAIKALGSKIEESKKALDTLAGTYNPNNANCNSKAEIAKVDQLDRDRKAVLLW